jgi:hypothetical protein
MRKSSRPEGKHAHEPPRRAKGYKNSEKSAPKHSPRQRSYSLVGKSSCLLADDPAAEPD